jgi:hypothetical protein
MQEVLVIPDLVILDIERYRGTTKWLYRKKGYLVGTRTLIYDTFWRFGENQESYLIAGLIQNHHIIDKNEILIRGISYGKEGIIQIAKDCDEAFVIDRFRRAFEQKSNNLSKSKLKPFTLYHGDRSLLVFEDLLRKATPLN